MGIVRTTRRVWSVRCTASKLLRSEIGDYYAAFRVTRDWLELRNLVDCAELIVRSALSRQESRGCISAAIPRTLPVSFPTILCKKAKKKDAWPLRAGRLSGARACRHTGPNELEGRSPRLR